MSPVYATPGKMQEGTGLDDMRRELNRRFLGIAHELKRLDEYNHGKHVFNVQDPRYGAVGNGLTDDTAAIQRAIDAIPDGGSGTVFGPPGSTFLLSDELTVTGKTVEFVMYGCEIVQGTTAKRVLVFDAELDFIRDVSAVDAANREITFTATGVEQGDVLKLVSDDRLEGTRAAPGGGLDYRQGQFGVVTSISGSDVTLNDAIRYTYTTNARVGKLSGHTVTWRGGTVRYDTSITSLSTCFDIYNAVNPIVEDVRFGYLPFIAVSLKGCFTYRVRDLFFNDSLYASPNLGHGVSDWSCYGADGRGLGGSRVRHCFTTNIQSVAADSDDLWSYGPSYGGVIHAGPSGGIGEAAFDTHHGCEDFTFIGGTVVGRDAEAVQIRGRRITVIGLRSYGTEGPLAWSETGLSSSDYSEDVTFIGCEFHRCPGLAANIRRINNARFIDCYFDRADELELAQVDEATVTFTDCRFRAEGDAGADANAFLLDEASTATFRGTTEIEIVNHTGTTGRLFTFAGTGAGTLVADDVRLTANSGIGLILVRNGADTDSTAKIERMDIAGPSSITRTSGDFTDGSFVTYSGTTVPSSTPDTTFAASDVVTFNDSGDKHVVQVANAAGNITLGGFAAGKFPGQLLTVVSRAGATTITIPDGTGSNGVELRNHNNADVVLGASIDSGTWIWTGATYEWIQIAGMIA